jgi:hypothetical protein
MRKEARHFWARARECRVVADNSRDEAARKLLLELAAEFEDEATKIEAASPEPS